MRGIIYGSTFERAKEQLEKIKENYEYINIKLNPSQSKINKYENTYIFMNGDIWQAIKTTESSRGRACNIAYIDHNLESETIDWIVMPTIKSYPYQAYKYF